MDFIAIARQSTRGEFVASMPFPFLVGEVDLGPSRAAENTIGLLDDEKEDEAEDLRRTNGPNDARRLLAARERNTVVLAIRKMTAEHPGIIRLGRAPRNDLVLRFSQISSYHAFFQETPKGFEVGDAGSRNGTWVGGRLLVPKGPVSAPLASGDAVRLAQLEFTFYSASAAWGALRAVAR